MYQATITQCLFIKIILALSFALVDRQFTLCYRVGSFGKGRNRSRKNLEGRSRNWSRTFYLRHRNPDSKSQPSKMKRRSHEVHPLFGDYAS